MGDNILEWSDCCRELANSVTKLEFERDEARRERDGWREKWVNDKGIRDELIAELVAALKMAQVGVLDCIAMAEVIHKAEGK